MSSYIGIFKMQFKGELQYRTKAITSVITNIFWGLMYVYLYTAFMEQRTIEGFSIAQMVNYIWLGQAFINFRYIGIQRNVADDIINGNVCYKFIRPINLYNQWFVECLGKKVGETLLKMPIMIIVAFLLPTSIRMTLPVSLLAFVLFIIALIIGVLICVSISMIAVILTFKTLSPRGVKAIIMTITSLLGGWLIPIPLMPKSLQNVLNFLPFRYISDLPIRIYIGNTNLTLALIQIGFSLLWLIILLILGKMFLKLCLRKTVIQGG